MKFDPNRSYLPSETLGKFYYQVAPFSKAKIYEFHVEKWNPFGNISIETTNDLPDDVNLVVGKLSSSGSSKNEKFPVEIPVSEVPDIVRKAMLKFVLERFEKELKDFKNW